MRVRSVLVVSTMVLALAAPGQAHAAAPLVHIVDEFSETSTSDDCGFTVRSDFEASVHVLVREVRDSGGQAFLGQENIHFDQVLTNPATGAWFRIHGDLLFKELTARHVEGTLWEFTVHEVGQPFVVENSDGDVVLRDRGRITIRAVFDTLGDGEPGGVLLEEEITGVHGPHPGLDLEFCDLVTELIG